MELLKPELCKGEEEEINSEIKDWEEDNNTTVIVLYPESVLLKREEKVKRNIRFVNACL